MLNDREKKKLAQQFLTGLGNRDWVLLRSIMAEDIIWTLPGNSLISGEAHGIDAGIKRAQTIVNYGVTPALKHILIGLGGFTLSLNNTAQREDLILNEHLATVCSLRNDKISAIDTYLSDVEMANAFFI